MRYERKVIHCSLKYGNTCRKSPFIVIIYKLNYNSSLEDRKLVDWFIEKAKTLSYRVNQGSANDSEKRRSPERIFANCIAGVVSEYFWKIYLNEYGDYVSETPYISASNQIDLIVNRKGWKIEVRSSFPKNDLYFVLCHPEYQFKVIGPYHNQYKPSEPEKHIYARTFFRMDKPTEIISKIKEDGFEIILAGGATWTMMMDDRYSFCDQLNPDDSNDYIKSEYRVVPTSNALDSVQLRSLVTDNI